MKSVESTPPTVRLLDKAVARTGGFSLTYEHCGAGAAYYLKHVFDAVEVELERQDA